MDGPRKLGLSAYMYMVRMGLVVALSISFFFLTLKPWSAGTRVSVSKV